MVNFGKPSISMGHLYHGELKQITRGYMVCTHTHTHTGDPPENREVHLADRENFWLRLSRSVHALTNIAPPPRKTK